MLSKNSATISAAVNGATGVGRKNDHNRLQLFWLREQGFSLKFRKLRLLSELPAAERLFAALLRCDEDTCRVLLSDQLHLSEMLEGLEKLVSKELLANLVLHNAFQMDLAPMLNIETRDQQPSALEQISKLARKHAAREKEADRHFAGILEILREHLNHILWTKGAHLSRSLYPKTHFRPYGDFDVIIHPKRVGSVIGTLQRAGFIAVTSPGFCNQVGCGPTTEPADLFVSPSEQLIPHSALTMERGHASWTQIDIKVGPLDRGLQAIELERFFADAEKWHCLDKNYLAPSNPDHLMISIRNFEKDRFRSWKTLFDIHLMVTKLGADCLDWESFVRSCKVEAISTSAWAVLTMAVDRLSSPVPESVLDALAPPRSSFEIYSSFTTSPFFIWNSTSLPMMICNLLTAHDGRRKRRLLVQSFFPDQEFLSKYYANRRPLSPPAYLICLVLHWFVLVMPGGVVRRTLGKLMWITKQPAELPFGGTGS